MRTLGIAVMSALLAVSALPSTALAQADARGPAAAAAAPDRGQVEGALRSAMGNQEFIRALVNSDQRTLQRLYAGAGGKGKLSVGPTTGGPSEIKIKICVEGDGWKVCVEFELGLKMR